MTIAANDSLSAGIRTVRQVAIYFGELRARAAEMAERGTAWQRGYFTPAEDEQIRWLLNSYWQSRNALFDVVTSLKRELEQVDAQRRPIVFLAALGGALLLVDAARFRRELAQERPHLQAKLNEAAVEFGIPEGVYDQVQTSLFSARHAWHLYHALRYYEEHADELRQAARAEGAEDLAELVADRLARANVPASRFLQARWKTRGGLLVRRVTADLFEAAMYGLQKFGGVLVADRYLRRGHVPRLPEPIAAELRQLLLPGDVLIVRKEFALTNYFLPGHWPHAALYLGTADQLRELGLDAAVAELARPAWQRLRAAQAAHPEISVLESMKDGVLFRPLQSPFGSDSLVVLRPRMPRADVARALARGLVHEGKPYDFDFDFRRSDRLVCTEVVYRAYDGIAGAEFPLVRRAGRPTLSGSDLIRLALRGPTLQPVAVYAPRVAGDLRVIQEAGVVPVLQKGERIAAE